MKIAIATDAWQPQVNGVVTTLTQTRNTLKEMGHEVLMVTPCGRRSVPLPSYPEIRVAVFPGRSVAKAIDAFQPDSVHIATEGPIGWAARRYCLKRGLPFTTAYHTQFPEYVRKRAPIPIAWTTAMLRRFHGPASRTMVPTESIRQVLIERGFNNVVIWSRGVLTDVFTPDKPVDYEFQGPIWVYVGRVAVEKNIEAFLDLPLTGTKVVIGDGPDRERLADAYPDSHFLGYKFDEDLASHLAGGDVFVFPSRTDTFGIVMLEAMACGLPVAAYPVTGPLDVIRAGTTGCLDEDLASACSRALDLNRNDCRSFALSHSWRRATEQFVGNLVPQFDS